MLKRKMGNKETTLHLLIAQYLIDLSKKFYEQHISSVHQVTRPYAFLSFGALRLMEMGSVALADGAFPSSGDTAIPKYKRQYEDTRSRQNVEKLNEELAEISNIMTQNIQEVLGQGEKLDHMSELSTRLSAESRKYSAAANKLSRQVRSLPLQHHVALLLLTN